MEMMMFTAEEAQKAYDEWGCNCGPSAMAAVLDISLDQSRKLLHDPPNGFDERKYTSPQMMKLALGRHTLLTGRKWDWRVRSAAVTASGIGFPSYGLARIQWTGPWTQPGVPARVAYRHSHWVGSRSGGIEIFDINAINHGGWIARALWERSLVPWLLRELEKGGDGWYVTHSIEVEQ